jgi:hypothetical protein
MAICTAFWFEPFCCRKIAGLKSPVAFILIYGFENMDTW